jgi:hypothetical protein
MVEFVGQTVPGTKGIITDTVYRGSDEVYVG